MDRFDIMLWAGALSDLAVGGLALAWASRLGRDSAGRPTLGLAGLLAAIVATTAVFFLKLLPMALLGMHLFGLIHLIYLDLAVVTPFLGLSLLGVASRSRRRPASVRVRPAVQVLAAVALLAPPVAAYATFIEPYALQTEETIVSMRDAAVGEEVRVVVVADLQFDRVTDYERDAIARAQSLRPDLIVIPGDVYQGTAQGFRDALPAIRELLTPLHAQGGVYLITGNMDRPERLRRLAEGTDLIVLSNRVVRTAVRGRTIAIGGVEDAHSTASFKQVAAELDASADAGAWTILLAHRPDAVLELDRGDRIDLTISGHTHGGQVCIPGWGPLIKLSRVPRAMAGGGLHERDNRQIYVSRGVGCERGQAPRIRFACPPEVSLLRLGKP